MRQFRDYCLNLPNLVPDPIFVKIGAFDGITDDPCSDILLANSKWKGLLVEPVPLCFDRLKVNFRDPRRFWLEQVAIGTSTGERTFYFVDAKAIHGSPYLPAWCEQLGSFDRNHILKHLNGDLDRFIVECKVQVCPLSDILTRNGIQHIHLLHIDVEGYDYEVLSSLNFARYSPIVIFVEHKHLSLAHKSEMLRLLADHGYHVHDCGEDYFAVNKEAHERLGHRF